MIAGFVIALGAWSALVLFFRRARAWLPYYVLASAGLAILLVVAAREVVPGELWLRIATAHLVHQLGTLSGVSTVLTVDPGNLIVVGVPHRTEWTQLEIGLESSGLLELAILAGLLAFFPAGGPGERALRLGVALLATFGANVLRVLMIVAIVGYFGQDSLHLAHIVLGRVAFFLAAMVIYWFAFTRPTLAAVTRRLREA